MSAMTGVDYQYIHANLVQLYGEGVLIFGAPASGKSYLSWQLLKRGHIHIADDVVWLSHENHKLIGKPLDTANDRMALRNAGILQINTFFPHHPTLTHSLVKIGIELVENPPQLMSKCSLESWELTYKNFFGISIKIYRVPIMLHKYVPQLLEHLIQSEQSNAFANY